MPTWLVPAFALGVYAVWAGTAAVATYTGDWIGFQVATPPMILVTGYVCGVKIIRGENGKNDRR